MTWRMHHKGGGTTSLISFCTRSTMIWTEAIKSQEGFQERKILKRRFLFALKEEGFLFALNILGLNVAVLSAWSLVCPGLAGV